MKFKAFCTEIATTRAHPALQFPLMSNQGYNPRDVSPSGFPIEQALQTQLKYLLHYAVLAPSMHNSQPWLFQVSGSSVHLYSDRSRALAASDPHVRSLVMSCGAAQYNYESALKAYGFEYRCSLFPDMSDADLLARTDVSGRIRTDVQGEILLSMKNRKSIRSGFHAPVTNPELINFLSALAEHGGTTLHWLTQEEVDVLSHVSHNLPKPTEHVTRETEAWRHPNRIRTRDGLPGERPPEFPFFGEPNETLSVAVLATHGDRMASWFRAGHAMEATLLYAESKGVGACLRTADAFRPHLERLRSIRGIPQLFVRFGYGNPSRATVRRNLVDVMIHPGHVP